MHVRSWIVGHNAPGYMPEADLAIFPARDWQSAHAALLSDLETRLDEAHEGGQETANIESALAGVRAAYPNAEVTVNDGEHAWWLVGSRELPDAE